MINLIDTHRILLSTASQRESGSILPLPACLTANGGAAKATTTLITGGLAEERKTSSIEQTRRTEDNQQYGAFITAACLAAIGIKDREDSEPSATTSS